MIQNDDLLSPDSGQQHVYGGGLIRSHPGELVGFIAA
jgi:hypothetical protein